ncbi:MAG: TMEM175 family protein [bacterium]
MNKSRLEAFSDGVLAIILTILVLELKLPQGGGYSALDPLMPAFASYALSFVFVGMYWVNHHHLLQLAEEVDGRILWMNLHLLFWLSLIPFATGWLAHSGFSDASVVLYGVLLLGAAAAYYLLARSLMQLHGPDSDLAKVLGADVKGRISVLIYILALAFALAGWSARLCYCLYVIVALMWVIPDPRIERRVREVAEGFSGPRRKRAKRGGR